MTQNSMEVHHERAEPWKVTLVDTADEPMTSGRLKRVSKYIQNEEAFFFTYGDGVSDVNITETLKFHQSHNKHATYPPGRFGALDISDGKIKQFKEKPKGNGVLMFYSFWIYILTQYLSGTDVMGK
jgi:glucose-1-phosphate cytidylyltransferase